MSERHAVADHFATYRQQHEAASLGMWIFLTTEIMLFGGLFLGYTVYRLWYPEMFHEMSHHLNLTLGTINTLILLTSSLTVVMAVHSVRKDKRGQLVMFLLLTVLLGVAFLGIKGYEYYEEYTHNLVPLPGLEFKSAPHLHADGRMFMNFYFVMTGIHALHLLMGICLMSTMAFLAWKGKFSSAHETPIEMSGMYWHLIDVIWVFLWPLLYLVGR